MKYIVYKTTNLVNNYIYIGVHLTADPNTFDGYIGCGVYVNNKATYNNPKTAFQQAVKEFGPKNFKREILSIYDSMEEAYLVEAQLVNESFLARPDVYNMILGGYEGSGISIKCYKYSAETGEYLDEYISIQRASLENNVCRGSVWNAILFKTKSAGYYWSTEKLSKLDISNYNTPPEAKPVYRYLVDSGKLDKEYSSYTQAAKDSSCTIVQVSRSAKLGYRVGIYQFSYIKAESYDKAKSIYLKTRAVYKYDSLGNFLEEYSTQKEAEFANPKSNITKSVKNKKPDENGFIWGLEKLEKFCSTQTQKKKVIAYTLEGDYIKEWESGKACIEETGVLRNYIKIGKPYKGIIYKYSV